MILDQLVVCVGACCVSVSVSVMVSIELLPAQGSSV